MLKKEVQGIKGFISSRSDDFRFPYGKAMTKNPRHCVLVGTTNDDTFLRDATGSRRFWVIVIHDDKHKTNITKILMIKEQLWAEALHLYRSGFTCQDCQAAVDGETRCDTHRWWLSAADDEFREEVNEQFTEVEPFIPWLQDWRISAATDKKSTKQGLHVAHKNTDSLKVHELLEAAGVVGDKCHDAWMQRRMVHALKYCGYTIKRTPRGNFWVSPEMAGKPSLSVVPKEEKEKEDTENKHEEKKSKIPE
jgi:predicted P-loop ATPase